MFWRRKLNGAAILFYTNRYFFVLWNLFQIPTTLFAMLGGRPISDEVSPRFAAPQSPSTEFLIDVSRLRFFARLVAYLSPLD